MSVTRILPSRSAVRNPSLRPSRHSAELPQPKAQRELAVYYDALFRAHGPQHWWPGRTRFEVIVGAILTQSTSWANAELAIMALRKEKLLSMEAIEKLPFAKLARLIRPSGYYRQKARKLHALVGFVRENYQGSLNKMFAMPTDVLREQLLTVYGIGPETADSILLYAGKHPVFVVDAYTRRIVERHKLGSAKLSYEEVRQLFETNLPRDAQLFNEYHALIVLTGKHFCHKLQADCTGCALKPMLPAHEKARL